MDPIAQLQKALLTINLFNLNSNFETLAKEKHFKPHSPPNTRAQVLWKDPNMGIWQGPVELIKWGQSYTWVSTKD